MPSRAFLGKSRARRRTTGATPDHILRSKDSGLSTKCYRGYVELRPARARDSDPGAMSSLDYTNPPSLALGCSDNSAIDALAHDTR